MTEASAGPIDTAVARGGEPAVTGAVHSPVHGPVRMSEARAAIERCITQSIGEAFGRDHASRSGRFVFPAPRVCMGSWAPGHDAGRVPVVPAARLQLRRDSDSPGVVFTWKVESGELPYPILLVPRRWLAEVVRPGHAVLDGHPVLQVLDRDPDRRPARVLVAVFGGYYDSAMHGWRAHGAARARAVVWAGDGSACLAPDEEG